MYFYFGARFRRHERALHWPLVVGLTTNAWPVRPEAPGRGVALSLRYTLKLSSEWDGAAHKAIRKMKYACVQTHLTLGSLPYLLGLSVRNQGAFSCPRMVNEGRWVGFPNQAASFLLK